MNPILEAQGEVINRLGKLFESDRSVQLEVREDRCFASNAWLSLGEISLEPELVDSSNPSEATIANAILFGQYRWHVSSATDSTKALDKAVDGEMSKDQSGRLEHILTETLEDIARRLCLVLPSFDADSIAEFPLRHPTTLVLDTSAVLQGGLDFASRFLYPTARLKVPAVVPLELLNMANTYFALRRSAPSTLARKTRCLREHCKSQGGQRALLRLEWHSDAEVERPVQGSDPLRIIFRPDQENEFKDLNLSNVERSFADRLVFESAREHQGRINPDHPVWILTSDQGLARMTLSEGMNSLYFAARNPGGIWGRRLTGTLFHPFEGGLYFVSLPKLLWEMATTFGAARLRALDTSRSVTVEAIGETLSWAPYHTKQDLLWCSSEEVPMMAPKSASVAAPSKKKRRGSNSNKMIRIQGHPVSANSISVPRLIRFVARLSEAGKLSEEESLAALELEGYGSLKEYRAFLRSGGFIKDEQGMIVTTARLDEFWDQLKSGDFVGLRSSLFRIPSFETFMQTVAKDGKTENWTKHLTMRPKTIPAYQSLAEISALMLVVPGRGASYTPLIPDQKAFVDAALKIYRELAVSDPWVLTGEWLEELAWKHDIHPVITRNALEQAFESANVGRYFEGSTPDTRFEDHTLDVLESNGRPIIRRYWLYHGDFLIGGRASVRLRLEDKRI
jgi:hypothetical protein